uniref:SUMO-conjugating enzyme UBC9 n=1 Tax=Ulva fasciata TaxID=111617 RepID=C7SBJ2_9CHLO|nr:E2 ubiquitin conjugating enzyme [Ulva fasciata]
MSGGLARQRLAEERKTFRKEKEFGFSAKPTKNADGSMDLLKWECLIPGKDATDWHNGFYPLTLEFTEEYPSRPPKCKFPAGFFHPNVYPSGTVCLSIINEDEDWRPSITVNQILKGIQQLLDSPNEHSPAQADAYMFFTQRTEEYRKKVLAQARHYSIDRVN